MSRILDALRKQDAQSPRSPELPRQRGRGEPPAAAEARLAEPARAPAEPAVRPAVAPPQAVEVAPVWPEQLPAIPDDVHREMSGLRMQVDGALAGRRPRVVMLTGSTRGEGTTTVTASFARVLAEDSATRVLVVEANQRRPGLASVFRLPGGPGLPGVLHAGHPFDTAVQAVERQNLHVLCSVGRGPVTANLYAQQLVRAFLGQHGAHYDYVLFDAPPLLDSPETGILGGAVDTTLLVVRASATKTGVVNRSLDALGKAGVPVLGLVLNRRRFDIPEFLYKRL